MINSSHATFHDYTVPRAISCMPATPKARVLLTCDRTCRSNAERDASSSEAGNRQSRRRKRDEVKIATVTAPTASDLFICNDDKSPAVTYRKTRRKVEVADQASTSSTCALTVAASQPTRKAKKGRTQAPTTSDKGVISKSARSRREVAIGETSSATTEVVEGDDHGRVPAPPGSALNATSLMRASTDTASAASAVLLHTLPKLFSATVVHRPSKEVKSPYLCDIRLAGVETLTLCHTPSLGCSGLVTTGATVLVSQSTSSTAKSSHVLHHVLQAEADGTSHWVGTHPMTANVLAQALLEEGHVFPSLSRIETLRKEVTMGNSRFDFVATHADGSVTVVETKNVPVADNFDGTKKERAALLAACITPPDAYHKIAIFPDGYRKKVSDPVSPRALKHVQELEAIVREGGKRACLLFISQRTDVASFVVTSTDMQYRTAVRKAGENGVVLKAFSVRWDGASGRAFLHRELPIVWDAEGE